MSTLYVMLGIVMNSVLIGVAAWQCRRFHDLNASMNEKHKMLNEIFHDIKKYVRSVESEQEYMVKDLERFEKRLKNVEGR